MEASITASRQDPTHIRWLKRFRPPILLALGALAFFLLPGLLRDKIVLPPNMTVAIPVLARMLFILAIGWAVTTIVDGIIKRRLGRLRLDHADNLAARKTATRLDVVRRIWIVTGSAITLAGALTVVPGVQQVGVSLFASAGIAGLVLGIAARPVLSNLIAGLQIAFTQPIRIEDAVVVEGEWGWIEEISLFYVVIRVWDWRRLVVPLSHFIEKPFQNWTRQTASIIGSVFWSVDYTAPVKAMRARLEDICRSSPLWSGDVVNLQVVETDGHTMRIRALASARTSPEAWDLRCFIREEMISWLQAEHPHALPRLRAETAMRTDEAAPQGLHFERGAPFKPDESLRAGPEDT